MDVARAARVSRTTASAALGGAGRISHETRQHVQAVARGLGYVANPAARHLQRGRKGAIGLYIPDNLTGFAFYLEFAFGAAAAARERAYALTLLPRADGAAAPVLASQVDGVLIVDPLVGDPFVPRLLESGLPVVASERYLEDDRQPQVTVETEHREAIAALLEHLWAQGARRPALLTLTLEFAWSRLVQETYEAWCREHRVRPCIRLLADGCDPTTVRGVARGLLDEPASPDAIVSAPDGTALGVLGAAHDVGRVVGRDVLVASCVDSLPMQFAHPSITAIDLRPREIGRDGANVLLRILHGEDPPTTLHRPRPQLVVRQSTVGDQSLAG